MKKPIIGSIEHVQIPTHGEEFVLAKVDTGADSSSIWASYANQEDGRLSYVFFGPGSTYFTGHVHKTRRYKVTTVKNSFGHSEVRYKIFLKIKIGDHDVKGWFTLADRSRNHYPILLGKSLLKDEFLVDVSRNHIHGGDTLTKNVLVISTSPDTADFLQDVERHLNENIELDTARFEDMLFDINGEATEIIDTKSGAQISNYALVYIKSHWNYPEPASALAEYLKFKNRALVDTELESYTSRSKLSEMMKLAVYGLPVPRSFGAYKGVLLKEEPRVIKELGLPFILKNVASDRGKDNYFVEDAETFRTILEKASNTDIYTAQKFVPNDGFYRVNVFDKDATMVVYRKSHTHKAATKQHLNKPAGGVNAELVSLETLPSAMLEIAVRAAMCMERQIAGADLLRHKETDEWFILEVNSSPQLRTGAFVQEKTKEFAKFIERRLEK